MSGQSESQPNRIEELANQLYAEGRLAELERELAKFSPNALDMRERESWFHLRGVSAFRGGDRSEALQRFEEAHQACPDSGKITFSLAQEYEFVGNTQGMFKLFDQHHFPAIPAQYALAQARYAYLWNQPAKALTYVLPIVDVYYKLGIADDTFLHIRGLPFFGETWAYLGTFHELTGTLDEFADFTKAAASRLTDHDFDSLLVQLEAIRTGDSKAYLTSLRHLAKRQASHHSPTGYTEMMVAVIEAQQIQDPSRAEERLDSVQLSAGDFPWLEDIRLLARCELAGRAGDDAREQMLRSEFTQKQALLFEPNHIFDFRLVAYQENLKPAYQQARINQ